MIKDDKQLYAQMLRDLERFMRAKSNEILERWRQLIVENWYQRYDESPYYKRTYELLASLTSTGLMPIRNGYQVELFFDTNMMHIAPNGLFIQHEDREILPDLIEEGYTVFGKEFKGARAYEEVISELSKRNFFLDDLKKEFGSNVTLTIR